ncbi:MAG: C1 family peptidase [Candidatus Zixiibacteriota bacterium]
MTLYIAALVAVLFTPALLGQMTAYDVDRIRQAIDAKGASWTAGETSRTRMSVDERRAALGSIVDRTAPDVRPVPQPGDQAAAPPAFTWGNYLGWNWMTSIKDQGGCGSCWAFATSAMFEARLRIRLNQPNMFVDVSEQNMVSCWRGSCDGANADWVMSMFMDNGNPDEACFPYVSGGGSVPPCDNRCDDWALRAYDLSTYGNFSYPSIETIKNHIVQSGPVAAHMDVYEDFNSYVGGVYEYVSGAYEGGHLVTVYGWDNATNCWLVKNSWGTDWGELGPNGQRGWFRIRMGVNEVGCESWIYYLEPIGIAYPVCTPTLPSINDTDAPTSANVIAGFSCDMDPATIAAANAFVYASVSGRHNVAIAYDNPSRSVTLDPASDFMAGEQVSVIMTPGCESASGLCLLHGHSWSYTTAVAYGTGAFGAPADYATAQGPLWISSADLNGDGSADLISANASAASLTVRLANGDGTLGVSTNYVVQNGPRSVVAADLNGDGHPDLAAANSQSNTLSVLLNNGDGTFGAAAPVVTVNAPRSVVAADFDADGDIDLAAASSDASAVRLHFNLGSGSFGTMAQRPATGLPYMLSTADFDGDGDFDLGYPAYSTDELVILWNDGPGTFDSESRYAVGDGPRSVAVADVNGDTNLDPITANYSGSSVSVLLKAGIGSYNTTTLTTGTLKPEAVCTADVNGDTHPDIAVYGSTGIGVFINDGDGAFGAILMLGTGNYQAGLASDMDGDGDLDLGGVSYSGQKMTVILNAACADSDGDGVGDPGGPGGICGIDNCPTFANPDQADTDGDGVGDVCDNCRNEPNPAQTDTDGNCPAGPYAQDPECGDVCQTCCRNRVGDANMSGEDEPTIGDVTVMIDAKFISGSCVGVLDCLTEADINQSGGLNATCEDISIGDITILIDYLFITGAALGLPDCL